MARVTALFLSFEQPRQLAGLPLGRAGPLLPPAMVSRAVHGTYPFSALHSLAASACYRLHSHGAARSFPQEHLSIFTGSLHHLQAPQGTPNSTSRAERITSLWSLLPPQRRHHTCPGPTPHTGIHFRSLLSFFLVLLPLNRLSPAAMLIKSDPGLSLPLL